MKYKTRKKIMALKSCVDIALLTRSTNTRS